MGRRNKKKHFKGLEVIDIAAKGKAIAKTEDGKVVFLSKAVPGDIVDVETFKQRKGYYEARVTNYENYSDKRSSPVCEYFGECGGCKWQNMQYEYQLKFKQKEVLENLKRIGDLNPPEPLQILGADEQYYYRNKMEFSFSNNRWLTANEISTEEFLENRDALGFHIPGMWDKILDISKCWLQADPSNEIRNTIKAFAVQNKLRFFNTRKQQGFLRTLMIRNSSIGEIMVVLQFFEEDEINRTALLNHVKDKFPEITSLQYVINSKANDTIYDQEVVCFHGRDHIFEEMEGLRFKINAKSFYQTNSKQAYELYKITRNFAELSGNELVYDLYTGTGTIALFIAKKASKVIGVESVPDAIKAAKENAEFNKIKNVEFYVGDMKKVFNSTFLNSHGIPDVVVTDPPRDGMHKDVIKQLLICAPKKIVYVSCNSATQARDLKMLSQKYEILKSQAVDMFPQTHHVENVVLLKKRI